MDTKEMSQTTKNFHPVTHFPENLDLENGLSEDVVEYTRKTGYFLCNINPKHGKPGRAAVTNSQIRNFFGEIKRIQMKLTGEGGDEKWQEVKSSFLLLKPKLAYAEGRALSNNRNSRMKELHQVLRKAMDRVKPEEAGARKRFLNFVDFFESILAYHKAFGGREN